MANKAFQMDTAPDKSELVESIRRARIWAWKVHGQRIPGPARDLAWSMIGLTNDHDPFTYGPWSKATALEPDQLIAALDLATEIARLIRKADELQPSLVRGGEAVQ